MQIFSEMCPKDIIEFKKENGFVNCECECDNLEVCKQCYDIAFGLKQRRR